MAITAALVKELRELTGVGMMDCKKALAETNGDKDAAVDWLRTKGLAKAAKKAGRVAAEGLVAIAEDGNKAVLVEVNSETDFVARNEQFQKLVSEIATVALSVDGDEDALNGAPFPGSSRTVSEEITEQIATIGENMTLRRSKGISVENGVIGSYVHGAVAPGQGKLGILVAVESEGDKEVLAALGKHIAMHIAASQSVLAINEDEVDPAVVEKEKSVFTEQARESGKPDNIIEKMVVGRVKKFLAEVVLLSQQSMIDPDNTISAIVDQAAKDAGAPVKIAAFERFALGEGIEKEEADFAAEVAAAAGV